MALSTLSRSLRAPQRLAAFLLAFALLVVAFPSLGEAQPRAVEVRILERSLGRRVEVVAPPGALILPGHAISGRLQLEARAGQLHVNGKPVSLPELRIGRLDEASRFELRWEGRRRAYPGRLRARVERDRLLLINDVPLEAYVSGVVSAEMPETWPLSTLRAQAVLARTLALKGGDHPGGALCDLTHCQAYAGKRNAEASQAAAETRGQVLTYRGGLIQPLYHSTCGGERISNATAFGGAALPYLLDGADPYCGESPHAEPWSVRVLESELAGVFGLPRLRELDVRVRSDGGWVSRIALDGRTMTGYRFWQSIGRELGWGVLKSMRFSVRREGNAFVFEGRGLGHGVGLCQWGAKGQADKGIPYARILASYFPGTAIARR